MIKFDTKIFKPTTLPPDRQIVSFINVYHDNPGYEDYIIMKSMMPDWNFKSYGEQCADGAIGTAEEMATIMQRSYLGFHVKGDEFNLYKWFACGIPIITRISDYKGKLGEELLENDETCFDLDVYNYEELCHIINNLSPVKYKYMSQQVYQRFLDTKKLK